MSKFGVLVLQAAAYYIQQNNI